MLVYYFRDIHKETIWLLCRRFTLFIGPRRRGHESCWGHSPFFIGEVEAVGHTQIGRGPSWGRPLWFDGRWGKKACPAVRVHVRVRQSKTLHFPVARRSPGIQPEFGNGVAG